MSSEKIPKNSSIKTKIFSKKFDFNGFHVLEFVPEKSLEKQMKNSSIHPSGNYLQAIYRSILLVQFLD